MKFFWDSANTAHIALHGITPEEVEQVIQNYPLDIERQIRNSEERSLHLGETDQGRVLFAVLTLRDEVIRAVTAFPADKKSREYYASEKAKTNAKNVANP